jgi:hypothetical protein
MPNIHDVYVLGAEMYSSALDELEDPRGLLANALRRIGQADEVEADLFEVAHPATSQIRQERRLQHLVDTANVLATIAAEAEILNAARPLTTDDEDFEASTGPVPALDDGGLPPVGSYTEPPRPTDGVRFTARLEGMDLGSVGGQMWLWAPGVGFVNVNGLPRVAAVNVGLHAILLSGRVVSSTPEQALCVTDQGIAVALPHGILHISPDDER